MSTIMKAFIRKREIEPQSYTTYIEKERKEWHSLLRRVQNIFPIQEDSFLNSYSSVGIKNG